MADNKIRKEQLENGEDYVVKTGTPVDNQVGVWTGDGTIEGTSGLVFSSNALGIGGVGNVGSYSGSVATVRGSNSSIFEMIRDITSSDSLLGRFVAGNTSNSVSSSIDFRSGTVNNRGQIRLMTSNGTANTEALRIDEAQKATFYNGGVNLDYSTASRVPVLDASKNLTASSVTDTELGYVSGVTSAIQTQLNDKAPLASPTFTGIVTLPTGLTGALRADSGVVSVDGTVIKKVKSSDEIVNNSTTLQNDDDLFFSVGANETWAVRMFIKCNSAATPDIKFRFSLPASATAFVTTEPSYDGFSFTGASSFIFTLSSGSDAHLVFTGYVKTAGTSGVATLQWAQNTAEASDTKVMANSYLIAEKLA